MVIGACIINTNGGPECYLVYSPMGQTTPVNILEMKDLVLKILFLFFMTIYLQCPLPLGIAGLNISYYIYIYRYIDTVLLRK